MVPTSTIRNILIGIYVLVVLAFSAVAKAEVTPDNTLGLQFGNLTKA